MKIVITKRNILDTFKYYLIITFILSWIAMYTGLRNGVVITFLLMAFFAVLLIVNNGTTLCFDGFSLMVIIYLIYNLIMVFMPLVRGFDRSAIISEVANSTVPILVYFISREFNDNQSRKFENLFCIMAIIIFIVGLLYNIRLDDPYYIEFLKRSNPGFTLLGFRTYPRINSVLGSVICGTWGCIGICFSYRNILENNNRKFWVLYGGSLILAVFSLQRSAMLCAIIFSMYFIFRAMKKRKISLYVPIIIVFVLTIGAVIILYKYREMLMALVERFLSIDSAVSERSYTWKYAFQNGFLETIFGVGIGTGGQRAIGLSANTINDGNYFKMIYEVGILGLIIFILIVICAVKRCNIESKKIYRIAIFVYAIQMLGSNTLTFQVTAIIFWYIIGRTNAVNKDNTKGMNGVECNENIIFN